MTLPRAEAILGGMALPRIKSTYSLDVDSVRTLEALSERWNVSKSEVIRRSLRMAAMAGGKSHSELALEALNRLQNTVRSRGVDIDQWLGDVKAERNAAEPRIPLAEG